ncbi:MAG: hypothetical protein JWQ44_1402 [Chthoniobacter sp.]|jgi:hypothetical protein|nr:hypothetical protein [Chthoniobacter sp.]
MKQVCIVAVVTALACGLSTSSFAAEKKKIETPAATPAEPRKAREEKPAPDSAAADTPAKTRPTSFHGDVVNLDPKAKTFTFMNKDGKQRVFAVTDKTTVTKDGAPANFSAITAGAYVTGSYIKTPDGRMECVTAKVGPKATKAATTEVKKP